MSDKEKEGKSDSSSESEKERSESEHESGDKKEKEVKQGGEKRRRKKKKRAKKDEGEYSGTDSDSDDDGKKARKKAKRAKQEEDKEKREDVMEGVMDVAAKDKEKEKPNPEMLTSKTGGAYIPPAKLRMMQKTMSDKTGVEFQRLSWEALKKSINGLINKVNTPNIGVIVRELFSENVVRGRGILCQSIITAQMASPTFTHVYAALAAVVNSKFPNIGELLLKRLILNFKRGYRRNDKTRCVSSTRFIAHLINQQVAHEVLALQILTLLLETPTDDSVEIAISFLKESGQKLCEVSPRGVHAIFESLRHVLHESLLDKRTQYMIEVMFQVRKDGFKDNPSVPEELDLVEEDDQFTHMLMTDDVTGGEEILNVFKFDPEYAANEEKYKSIKRELLDQSSSSGSGSSSSSSSGSDSEEGGDDDEKELAAPILDATETNLIALRRTIYLTIQSSLDYEEAVHKLLKMQLKPGHETELCNMILDCCAQQRTYEKFFGLMAQRFCQINKTYVMPFQETFASTYNTVHRLEIGKLRNVGKLFGHLLHTDSMSWEVISVIRLNEEETTSSSRIFIKILFQELAEYMGITKLNERLRDPTLAEAFEGIMPRDDPMNTRFAVNFFTSIGLGSLTEDLRAHLKNQPAKKSQYVPEDSSSSSSSSDSSSSSSSSEEERRKRRKKKKKEKKKKEKKERKASPPPQEDRGTRKPARSPERRKRDEEPERRRRDASPVEVRGDERRRDRSPTERRRDERRRDNNPTERRRDERERDSSLTEGRRDERRKESSPPGNRRNERRREDSSPTDNRKEGRNGRDTSPSENRRERRDRNSPERRRKGRSPEERKREKSPERRRRERSPRERSPRRRGEEEKENRDEGKRRRRRHDSSEAESEKGRDQRRRGSSRESPAGSERVRSGGRRRERHDSD